MAAKFELVTTDTDIGKVPPQALDLEEVVLGALMVEENSYDLISLILKPDMFYVEAHKKIYEAIVNIHNKNGKVDTLTVTNYLRQKKILDDIGGPAYISTLTHRVGTAAHIVYHSRIVQQKYIQRELIKLCAKYTHDCYEDEDIKDILDNLDGDLSDLSSLINVKIGTFDIALKATIEDIKSKSDGTTLSFLKTKDKLIDEKIKWSLCKVVYVVSPPKHGKTSAIIWMMRMLLDNYKELAIQWYSFEDPKEKIIRRFISQDVGLNDEKLQSKGYKLTDEDKESIELSTKNFGKYDIEFVEASCSILAVKSSFKLFCKQRKDKYNILIIDNVGLLTDAKKSQTETDDFISKVIIDIREQTKALIIPVHHINKDQEDISNLKYAYRPRLKDIKGSTRTKDYANQVLIIERPSKYKDLVAEESIRWKNTTPIVSESKTFSKIRFENEFWALNPREDKETEKIENLFEETWKKLSHVIENEKDKSGNHYKLSFILKKYQDYCNYSDSKNSGRESKYQKEKVAIYTFLKKKMFNNSYKNERSSRDEFLYGDLENPVGVINKLFIIDNAADRDGGNEGVLRFEYDDCCRFKDINFTKES